MVRVTRRGLGPLIALLIGCEDERLRVAHLSTGADNASATTLRTFGLLTTPDPSRAVYQNAFVLAQAIGERGGSWNFAFAPLPALWTRDRMEGGDGAGYLGGITAQQVTNSQINVPTSLNLLGSGVANGQNVVTGFNIDFQGPHQLERVEINNSFFSAKIWVRYYPNDVTRAQYAHDLDAQFAVWELRPAAGKTVADVTRHLARVGLDQYISQVDGIINSNAYTRRTVPGYGHINERAADTPLSVSFESKVDLGRIFGVPGDFKTAANYTFNRPDTRYTPPPEALVMATVRKRPALLRVVSQG